jgi:hypothetical protein
VYDLFLSYHWRDHEPVEALAHALQQRGVKPFLDRWYLVPGRSWVDVLEGALHECKAAAIFVGPHGLGPWQQREKGLSLDRQAKDPSFAVIPVLLPGADPALGFLSLNTWVDLRNSRSPDRLEILIRAARGEVPGHDLRESVASAMGSICPYRGLRPFREEDEPFFCGRESFTGKLVDAMHRRRVIAVVGASGSGKSSVVRAGLMPELRHGKDSHVWDMLAMLPQDRPLHSLAACFLPLIDPELSEVDRLRETEKLGEALRAGEIKLRTVIDRALAKQPGTDRLLLVVDGKSSTRCAPTMRSGSVSSSNCSTPAALSGCRSC